MRSRRKKNRHARRRARRLETLTHNPGGPGEEGASVMSDFWKDRQKMRQRTEEARATIPENPIAPPAGPGSPAAEHKAAQEKLTAAVDGAAKSQGPHRMGGE